MLTKLNNKTVRGPYFTVIISDIHTAEYVENPRRTLVEIEGGMAEQGKVDWVVYSRTLVGWLPPYDSEEIKPEKRKEILHNLSESLSALGMVNKIVA